MINESSEISEVKEHCRFVASANYNLALQGISQASSPEHIELALNIYCGEIEALRRLLAKSKRVWPLAAPGRVRVIFPGDRYNLASDLLSELVERWPGLANGSDSVSGSDLVEFLTAVLNQRQQEGRI